MLFTLYLFSSNFIFNDAPEPQLLILLNLLSKSFYNYIFNDFISSHMVFSILIFTKSNCYIRKFSLFIQFKKLNKALILYGDYLSSILNSFYLSFTLENTYCSST